MNIEYVLILKIIVSVGVVLVLSYIAEAVSSKWAGIISGLPTGSAIMLYFYAFENGKIFASESALYNMIGLVAMQSFICGYYLSNKIIKRPGIVFSTIIGLLLYFLAAILISFVNVTQTTALIVSPISFLIFIRLFKNIKVVDNKRKVTLTKKILFIRSLTSGLIIVIITTIANLIGSRWSGIFSAFPTTLYPLLVIIHKNYGKNLVDSVIKYVPQGLTGLLIYSYIIHVSYKSTGINYGMFLAFMGTFCYLLLFSLFENLRKKLLLKKMLSTS